MFRSFSDIQKFSAVFGQSPSSHLLTARPGGAGNPAETCVSPASPWWPPCLPHSTGRVGPFGERGGGGEGLPACRYRCDWAQAPSVLRPQGCLFLPRGFPGFLGAPPTGDSHLRFSGVGVAVLPAHGWRSPRSSSADVAHHAPPPLQGPPQIEGLPSHGNEASSRGSPLGSVFGPGEPCLFVPPLVRFTPTQFSLPSANTALPHPKPGRLPSFRLSSRCESEASSTLFPNPRDMCPSRWERLSSSSGLA